ncbi:N-acetylmuramoyl-L-alanine amidase A [Streptomyces sp. YIM 130001]|uniref:peptidoglycan-binding protein n=1 Tax=Streptomyces sp. YIM 130001 TaxID=2259644 RepID=UPI000E651C34|nr:peptidoglycan-binding protein [Streptomyces sp. YIM 130001]RII09693.1 N-acetylmuramoyl-L-alanine amidase A [Streptomyces sp. YIM 130001]
MLKRTPSAARVRTSVLATVVVTTLSVTGLQASAAPEQADEPMNQAFEQAAEDYGVPRDLLTALGYGETHLDGHDGRPSQARGYGVMHLVDNPTHHSLQQAAEITGRSTTELRRDTAANIEGGAAVLRAHADALGLDRSERGDINAWYPAVARYGNTEGASAKLYADAVYDFLAEGLTTTVDGEEIAVDGRKVSPARGALAEADMGTKSEDYPPALWVPASTSNYASGRSATISQVVVHVTQGSYAGTVSWFQNPEAETSSHYVVRSSDGEVTQMVRDADTAWHARSANASALGIEHEGYVDDPSWFTDSMYRSSAALTKHLCDKYGIPKDREHIVGHVEVPGNDHTDPGPHWNWEYYMELVGGDSGGGTPSDGLSFTSYEKQRSGSTGAQVKAVQSLLSTHGYEAGAADGDFGTSTLAAVKAFQKDIGLEADGVVGAKTWTALLAAGSKSKVSKGSSGDAVTRLQRALTAALGSTVGIDGTFGAKTDTALRSYQKSHGLTVDGVAGDATWKALQAGN